jgi:carbohydrate diacid regulator
MVITEELAQKIVGTVMPVVHRNVNIMNREGVIIGTGQPERLKNFHKGALDVVESGNGVEIFPDELSRYPGARQGVNLPILLEGQIVGVVGVLGLPDEVRDTARMVKLVTELLLEQELSHREAQVRSRLREEFLESALHHNGHELPQKVRRLARALGFSLEGSRCVVVVDLKPQRDQMLAEGVAPGLVDERMEELVETRLQQEGLLHDGDLSVLREEQMVVLRGVSANEDADKTIPAWLWQLQQTLSKLSGNQISCAAGCVSLSAVEYPASYNQARFCLARCSRQRPARSLFDRELLVRYLAAQASSGQAAIALRPYDNRFKLAAQERSYLQQTLSALLAANLDAGRTADQLGIHRNSLAYRLQRIREELDLDPVNRTADVALCFALLDRR